MSRMPGQVPARVPAPPTINPSEAIAGRYIDSSDVSHDFLCAPNGTTTTFDAPGAGTGPGQGNLDTAELENIDFRPGPIEERPHY
jgi:hypothetical protein